MFKDLKFRTSNLEQENIMHPRRSLFFSLLSLIVFGLSTNASSQANEPRFTIEPSYDVVLQVVIGGDDKSGSRLPDNLNNVAKQLKNNYQFADYRLANTYVGRIANGGNFEFKSLSNIFGRPPDTDTPSFLEWTLGGLRAGPNASGKNDIMLQVFRFGARIPIRTGSFREEGGKQLPIINYEAIGLSSGRVTLSENTPTLLGSLSLPTSENSMFLVLTLRPA